MARSHRLTTFVMTQFSGDSMSFTEHNCTSGGCYLCFEAGRADALDGSMVEIAPQGDSLPTIEQMIEEMHGIQVMWALDTEANVFWMATPWDGRYDNRAVEANSPAAAIRALYEKWKAGDAEAQV